MFSIQNRVSGIPSLVDFNIPVSRIVPSFSIGLCFGAYLSHCPVTHLVTHLVCYLLKAGNS